MHLKFRRGFSIIELLISLTIMGIITMVAVGNFRVAQQRQEIKGVAQTLASDLRRAQAMSFNGTKTPSGALQAGENNSAKHDFLRFFTIIQFQACILPLCLI